MSQRGRSAGSSARRAGSSPSRQERRPTGDPGRRLRTDIGQQSRGGDLAARRARLRTVIEPVVVAAGYDLEDVSVGRAGRRHVVRVVVDSDQGVSLDAIAEVSRAVSRALDEAEENAGDLIVGEYQLEVSSPGVDRPLTLARHWRRNAGRLVKVAVRGPGPAPEGRDAPAVPGDRQVVARVLDADDDRVLLDLDGRRGQWRYADLGPGRVQVEFSRLDDAADEDLGDLNIPEEVEDEER
jgi:ribosome maturation factor RimP